jgi:serine/threonine-protein kinase
MRPVTTTEEEGTTGSTPDEPRPDSAPAPSAAAVEGTVDPLIGALLAGRYRVEKLLGAGGMGSVYRAAHVHMRKAVALKVLHREMTYMPEVVARFEREAVAAARIEHANVATATDFGRLDDGAFYLVLEYIEGRSLSATLAEAGALPAARALHITSQIADALAAAHAAEIVHRDLKPDNVMLIEREGDPDFVKVLDFGIAKVRMDESKEQPALTQVGAIFGTPQYMAPEQAAGQPVDARADLYTLGLILYEMLAGKKPFDDGDLIVLLMKQMTAEPPPLPGTVEPRVAELVMQLLAKSPAARVQSAAELVRRIDALLALPLAADAARGTVPAADQPEMSFGDTVLSVQGANVSPQGGATAASAQAGAAYPTGGVYERRRFPEIVRVGLDVARSRLTPVFKRRLTVAGRTVPVWSLAAVPAAAALALGIAAAAGGDGAAPVARQGPTLAARLGEKMGLPPTTDELIRRARSGDRAALTDLHSRPEATRSAEEWLAVGHGRAKIAELSASVAAYEKAIAAQPNLAADTELLANVKRAAVAAETADAALKLAATGLGAVGADLLYDVAADAADPKTSASARKAEQWLQKAEVAAKASPALTVLLQLRRAKGCAALKKLLPQVAQHGDARSAARLRKTLANQKGCGILSLGDCYSCVRGSALLKQALQLAEARPSRRFD